MQQAPSPLQDGLRLGDVLHRGPLLQALGQLLERHLAITALEGGVAALCVVPVARQGHEVRVALEEVGHHVPPVTLGRHDHARVVLDDVAVAGEEVLDVDAVLPVVGQRDHEIAEEAAVVAAIVHLEAVRGVEDVVLDVVEGRPVVVVHPLAASVVRDNEVPSDQRRQGGEAIAQRGEEGEPVPAVDGPMVAGLPASVPDEV
mmetsp:Transcript_21381/g.66894  ORF Transcript_21381/g.66894 Transcript_21381/m.66894 type:complete len:202 (-) Transcript_21381:296-901(-)